MGGNALVIYDNVAAKLATWTEKRIGKFFKAYYSAKRGGEKIVNTGDDAIDVLISCLLTSSAKAEKRGRGGQPGNRNAAKSETNKNECETNLLYNKENNIIEEIECENNNNSAHIHRDSLLPFPQWMTAEEKRQHLWRDIVNNQGAYPDEMLKDFFKYYAQPSTRSLGKLACEECIGWKTSVKLERWANQNNK